MPIPSPTKVSRQARRAFPHAQMSDTKWRKMFAALDEAGAGVEQMIVKFIDVDEPLIMRLPNVEALHTPYPYFDSAFGPTPLRAIEWIDIPAIARWPRADKLPALEIQQDLAAVLTTLSTLGRYPVETISNGIRIVAYSR